MQLKTITELLHLPNFHVKDVLEQTENTIHLYVDMIEQVAPVCSACKTVHHSSVHSIGWIMVEQFSWLRGRFTACFAEQVYRLISIATNAEAGWYLGLDDETVYCIDRGILEELAGEKLFPVSTPSSMDF